jgi:hypothetical protein
LQSMRIHTEEHTICLLDTIPHVVGRAAGLLFLVVGEQPFDFD